MIQRLSQLLVGIVLALPLLHEARADTVTYYHNDLLGSPVAATNQAGQVIWRENYRPYGERLTKDAQAQDNSVWYTSKPQDADTGLVYLGARYYDPVIGRFLSADPVGFDEKNIHSFNRYAYANNNPYKFVDPSGHSPLSLIAWEVAKATGIGYALGVAADAVSQSAAFGSVDFAMAATSSAAQTGGEAGLIGGALSGAAVAFRSIAATRDTTTLYRAVSEAEAAQVRTTGQFEAGTNSLGGKWFAETKDHAKRWGDLLNGEAKSIILETKISKTQADSLMKVDRLDNIGPARYGEFQQLKGAAIREIER
jgi:RHS repeat-associated protein